MTVQCGKGHTHPTVTDVRACYTRPLAPATVAPVTTSPRSGRRFVTFTESEPTQAQVNAIKRLGGSLPKGSTRGEASSIIGRLYAQRSEGRSKHKEIRVSTPPRGDLGTTFPFPAAMLFDMHEARFAVSPDGSDRLQFVRLSLVRPYKNGRPRAYQGSMKVQTQHGDDLIDRVVVNQAGKYRMLTTTMTPDQLAGLLALIVVNQRGAAALYGQELGMCCRCGKTLTDERSRWYGLGPECEKVWPEIVYESDENRGIFAPSVGVQ